MNSAPKMGKLAPKMGATPLLSTLSSALFGKARRESWPCYMATLTGSFVCGRSPTQQALARSRSKKTGFSRIIRRFSEADSTRYDQRRDTMPRDILDNRHQKLVDHLREILPSSQAAKFAVGYFSLSRLEAVAEQPANVHELRLLIGNASNRETIEQIAEGYRRLEPTSWLRGSSLRIATR